jgi:hypothetical protein
MAWRKTNTNNARAVGTPLGKCCWGPRPLLSTSLNLSEATTSCASVCWMLAVVMRQRRGVAVLVFHKLTRLLFAPLPRRYACGSSSVRKVWRVRKACFADPSHEIQTGDRSCRSGRRVRRAAAGDYPEAGTPLGEVKLTACQTARLNPQWSRLPLRRLLRN